MNLSGNLLRVAIVDDEPLARARLLRLLEQEEGVELVGEYGDGATAAAALRTSRCDVVLLDIRMPETDGFAMLESLPDGRRPLVVFVTAHRQHALRAFDTWAVDYLLKPVGPERLAEALQRVRERLLANDAFARGPTADAHRDFPERIAIPDGQRLRVVRTADIEVVLAQGNYVEVRTAAGSMLLRDTLNHLEANLDPRRFLRIHRSRIVRIDLIEQIEAYGAGQYWLRLRNGTCLTSGRAYRERLLRAYGLAA